MTADSSGEPERSIDNDNRFISESENGIGTVSSSQQNSAMSSEDREQPVHAPGEISDESLQGNRDGYYDEQNRRLERMEDGSVTNQQTPPLQQTQTTNEVNLTLEQQNHHAHTPRRSGHALSDFTNRSSIAGRYIRKLSSSLEALSASAGTTAAATSSSTAAGSSLSQQQHPLLDVDRIRLCRILRDIGEDLQSYSCSVGAVEVWALDEDETGMLIQPAGGWWHASTDLSTLVGSNEMVEALAKLEQPAEPVMPGVDLAGELWSEVGAATGPSEYSSRGGSAFGSIRGGNIFGAFRGLRRANSGFRGSQIRRNASNENSTRGGSATGSLRNGNNFAQLFGDSPNPSTQGGEMFGEGHRRKGETSVAEPCTRGGNVFGSSSSRRQQKEQLDGDDGSCGVINVVGTPTGKETDAENDNKSNPSGGDGKLITPKLRESHRMPMPKGRHHRRGSTWGSSSDRRLVMRLTTSFDPRHVLRLPGSKIRNSRSSDPMVTTTERLQLSHRKAQQQQDEFPANPHTALVWRDLLSLSADPDSPTSQRLVLLEQAGFVKAAGVPFDSSGHKGLVVYLARRSDGDRHEEERRRMSLAVYMIRSAEVIGAVVAAADARKAIAAWTIREELRRQQVHSDEPMDNRKHDAHPTLCSTVHNRVRVWFHKCKGGNFQPPPPTTVRQSLWTFLGVLCGLLLLSSMNQSIRSATDGDLTLLLGPLGALMTLQYGLTAAPASQPRNTLLGQTVAGATALLFTYIPDSVLRQWIRQAVAPAVAIALTSKLGVIHPPAGAAAVLLSSGRYGWAHYGLLLASCCASLVPAVIVNNWSRKRQYPTYWGLLPARLSSMWCPGTRDTSASTNNE